MYKLPETKYFRIILVRAKTVLQNTSLIMSNPKIYLNPGLGPKIKFTK